MPSQPLYPNESDLEVLLQRCLLRKFFSSPCYPLFNKGSFLFFVFELFRKYSASEDYFGFLLLLLQAIVIIMGISLINAKAKSITVFAIILFSLGIEGDS